MKQSHRIKLTRWVLLVLIVATVELWVRAFGIRYVIVPPSVMLTTLWTLLFSGELGPHLGSTAAAIALSFLLAVALGIPAGVLLGVKRTLKEILDPYLIAYHAVPLFAFYPLFISFFGLGVLPIVFIGTLSSVFGIIVNTAMGVQKVKGAFLKVGKSLQMSRSQMVLKVYLPAAVPYVFTGMRLGLVYAFLSVITSEFILSARGIGYYTKFQYATFRTEQMYATVVLIIVTAVGVNLFLIRLENALYRRGL